MKSGIAEIVAKDVKGRILFTVKPCTLPSPDPTDHIWDMWWGGTARIDELESHDIIRAFSEAVDIYEEEE